MEKEVQKYGKAYAFFDCSASKAEIENELPKARHYAEVPSELELSLTEGTENLSADRETRRALEFAKDYSLNRLPEDIRKDAGPVTYRYALTAKLPNATNQAAANKLNNIMNLLYGKQLYPPGEEFFGEIVYEDKGRYVSN